MSEYRRIEVRASDRELAERALAEAWAAGAAGLEEREGERPGEVRLIVYFGSECEHPVRRALRGLESAGLVVGESEAVEAVDWSEEWKRGLCALEISDRLLVRPSFVESAPRPGQYELAIDPGQAFGTGGHASTRLALEWIDSLSAAPNWRARRVRVLDVGTGTGVLAMAALALGARRAVAFDLDPRAAREAAHWFAQNRLERGILLFCGPISALHAPSFDLVLVNMLRREMTPIAGAIAGALSRAGSLVLSGLLEDDRVRVERCFAEYGLRPVGARTQLDASGERWIAPLLRRA